ncbi:MAG: universal stress protein [Chloroflexota bacterium]|nr:universal stress protein [Chloroflexota bacterium]
MYKRILVPLDGSARAERALPIAARLAQAGNTTVHLVRVFNTSDAGQGLSSENMEVERKAAEKYLERTTQSSELAGMRVETQVIQDRGEPAATIISLARRRHVDFIVLCSHGYTGKKRLFLGSVAESIARHAPCPVLIIREGGPVPAGLLPGSSQPTRVLVPLDGSELAEVALLPAARLAATLGHPDQGFLHCTRVVILPASDQISLSVREEIIEEAKIYLQRAIAKFHADLAASTDAMPHLSITSSVMLDDDVAAGIARLAETGESGLNYQVIAMATHVHSEQESWSMGSITERVLQATRLPMLIL